MRPSIVATLHIAVALDACRLAGPSPLAELPAAGGSELRAVLLMSERDCDSNLAAFGVFDRDEVRRAVPLVGVVALEPRADSARIRRSLAAFDVHAPVLTVRDATRESLRAASHDHRMTVLIVRRDRVALALRPAEGSLGLVQFKRDVLALTAAHLDSSR